MQATVIHLVEQPQHRTAVAALIHDEFWQQVPGASVARMAERLAQAASAQAIPLCLVALRGSVPIGAVNLVDNDDEAHPEWRPWLAGMVVERAYLGTDGPGFYERLGAARRLLLHALRSLSATAARRAEGPA